MRTRNTPDLNAALRGGFFLERDMMSKVGDLLDLASWFRTMAELLDVDKEKTDEFVRRIQAIGKIVSRRAIESGDDSNAMRDAEIGEEASEQFRTLRAWTKEVIANRILEIHKEETGQKPTDN